MRHEDCGDPGCCPDNPEPTRVLDHGFVRLVDSMGSDLSVVRSAKVSYDAAWRAGVDKGSDERLIRYLWKHQHTSPFESVTLTFEVKAPIFVFRQWHRHRTWSYNELSARYRELSSEYYIPDVDDIGVQSKNTKQAREIVGGTCETEISRGIMQAACEAAFIIYRRLLDSGVPRELARTVLPLATYSQMFATVNLLNLFRFCTLRLDPHAQMEIRVYAKAMLELAREVAPICVSAWEEPNG
jgi:thymidylate synthase (FAD)